MPCIASALRWRGDADSFAAGQCHSAARRRTAVAALVDRDARARRPAHHSSLACHRPHQLRRAKGRPQLVVRERIGDLLDQLGGDAPVPWAIAGWSTIRPSAA
jgi:hypothetical protein